MLLSKENFYQTLDVFRTLPVSISTFSEECFCKAFGDDSAAIESGIIYIFRSAKPVSRLRGESDVLYIGQTKGTLRSRYLASAKKMFSSKANSEKYEHILSEFGPIRISVASHKTFGETLLKAEGQLLWWYFQNHCEYPPLNYTKTSARNDLVELSET